MFKLIKKSKISHARSGILKTSHGKLSTPFFMPVATQGVLKQVSTEEIRKLGAQIILSNTYHLMLRPGSAQIRKYGGLHSFMDWDSAILTDSGGFQIFSLAGTRSRSGRPLVKLDKDGARFKSYIDGSEHYLTPERSIKIQAELGVDIAVCLDECAALPATRQKIEQAMELTTRWARKSKAYHRRLKAKKPLLFAVVQGGLDKELRLKSAGELMDIGFDGYNIGGLSVGESAREMYGVLDYLTPALPEDKPRYLMGVGYPENIIEAVRRGVDMFDCVIPTREGRHGRLFQMANGEWRMANFKYKTVHITSAKYSKNLKAINPHSKIKELRRYSLAYLHYLFKIKEPLGQRLATLNNLEFYLDLMEKIRQSIKKAQF